MLPEFQGDNTFPLIRAEAAALDDAVNAWAEELRASIVVKLCPIEDMLETVQKKQQAGYDVVFIGVTMGPAHNLKCLSDRNQESGQSIITDWECIKRIRELSADNGFDAVSRIVSKAILVSSEQGGNYTTIYAAKEGDILYQDDQRYNAFRNYAFLTQEEELLSVNTPPNKVDNKPKP